MNLGDFFFGSEPELQVEQKSTLTPEQDQLLKELIGFLGSSGGAAGGVTPFGGNLNSATSNLENMSLAAMEERSRQLATGGSETDIATDEALQRMLSGEFTDTEDFFTNAIEAPALRDFEQNVLPGISRDFGGSGFFSTERAEADASARQDLTDSLTSARSGVALSARESALDRMLQAIGLSQSGATNRSAELGQLLSAGGVPRSVEEGNITRNYDEFKRQQDQAAQRVSQILASLGVQGVENIGAALPGSPGFISELLAAFAGGTAKKGT